MTASALVNAAPLRRIDLGAELLSIVERAQSLDVRTFEKGSTEDALQGLVPGVVTAVGDAMVLCQAVLAVHDDEPDDGAIGGLLDEPSRDTGVFLRVMDEAVAVPDTSYQVATLAFLGRTALAPKRGALERLSPDREVWDVISECDSTRRRIVKTLTVLETALASVEGREARLALSSELGRSLETRRRYAQLRLTFLGEEFSPERALILLRKCGTAIAILIGQDIYPDLRIADRRQIRSLQGRILDWLRAPNEPDSPLVAQRLFQDLAMFAGLIAQVRHREELVEHDIEVLARLREPTEDGQGQEMLGSLHGLDDDLDALLENPPLKRDTWLPVVRQLGDAMRARQSGSF